MNVSNERIYYSFWRSEFRSHCIMYQWHFYTDVQWERINDEIFVNLTEVTIYNVH